MNLQKVARHAFLIVGLAVIAVPAHVQEASQADLRQRKTVFDSEAASREILKLEEERVEAYRQGDIAELERRFSADYTISDAYGEFGRRDEAIRYLRDEYLPSNQRNDDITIRIYGPTAVVTGRTVTSFVVNGWRATNHARFLRLWIKQPDGWRNVVFQGTFVLRRFSEEPQPPQVISSRSAGVPPAASGRSGDAKGEVLRLEDQRLRALRQNDASALERLLAPEYVFVDPLGVERTRAEILAGIARASGTRRSGLQDDGVEVRVYGNAAVVTGRTITRLPNPERTTSTRFTRVWIKHGDSWRLVVYQATHEIARTTQPPTGSGQVDDSTRRAEREAKGKQQSKAFVNWARKNAIPIATTEPGKGFKDLQPIKKIIDDKPYEGAFP